MKSPLAILLLAAFHLALVMQAHAEPPALAASSWAVTDMAGLAPLPEHPITFEFDTEGNITGDASCNRFGGGCTFEGDKITVGPVRATRRACEEPVMSQERTFLRLLAAVQSWELPTNDQLVLRGPEGDIKARRRAEDAAHDGE